MRIRLIEQKDVDDLVFIDQAAFGGNEGAMTEAQVLAVVRRRGDKDGVGDTRTYVLERHGRAQGGFALEVGRDGYVVLWFVARPEARLDCLSAALTHLKGRCVRSPKRHGLVFRVRDRQEVGLEEVLPTLKEEGFVIKLAGGGDNWEGRWRCP